MPAAQKMPACPVKIDTYCNADATHEIYIQGERYEVCGRCYKMIMGLVQGGDVAAELPEASNTPTRTLQQAVNRWHRASRRWPDGSKERQRCLQTKTLYEQAIKQLGG